MPKPRLTLRVLLIASLFIGAVALPWGWRTYHERRSAEIDRLKRELTRIWVLEPSEYLPLGPGRMYIDNPSYGRWKNRVSELQDELEDRTGRRPKPWDRPWSQ